MHIGAPWQIMIEIGYIQHILNFLNNYRLKYLGYTHFYNNISVTVWLNFLTQTILLFSSIFNKAIFKSNACIILQMIWFMHDIWVGPLTALISLYIMYQYIGIVAILGLLVGVASIPVSVYVGNKVAGYRYI